MFLKNLRVISTLIIWNVSSTSKFKSMIRGINFSWKLIHIKLIEQEIWYYMLHSIINSMKLSWPETRKKIKFIYNAL